MLTFCAPKSHLPIVPAALGLLLLLGTVTLTGGAVQAAEFTDLMDAADDFDDGDEGTWDPFDFSLEPSFSFVYESAQIAREAPCTPQVPEQGTTPAQERIRNNPRLETGARCSEPRTVYNREMLYVGKRTQLDVALRLGLYKDLELRVNLPYVFSNTRQLGYDDSDQNTERRVSASNSSVDPASTCAPGDTGRCIQREAQGVFVPGSTPEQLLGGFDQFGAYRFFDLGSETAYTRSGFAEPSVGLHWAMFNDQRDPTKATLLLGLDYTMPIVPIATRQNDDIGRGLHELDFTLASSKKFGWIEPYFGMRYTLPIAATDSPIQEVDPANNGQVFTTPPMSGEITIGTEFIPFEDVATGQRYGIDLRFDFGYTGEGRDYTPLFDHVTRSQCNGKRISEVLPQFDGSGAITNPDDLACGWIVQQPSNAEGSPIYDLDQAVAEGRDPRFFHDGIMTVEGHANFRGSLGLYLQPTRFFQLKLLGSLEHRQEHFLTNARTGEDLEDGREVTDDDTIDLEGPDAQVERNPVYNATYDSAGERFRIQSYTIWRVMVTAALQF